MLLALVALSATACSRLRPPPPPGTDSSDAVPAGAQTAGGEDTGAPALPASPNADANLEELRALGPTYIPVDRDARLRWDTEAEATLRLRLLPILGETGLPATTETVLWVLVGPDGAVAETVVQTSSGNGEFDAAAAGVATALHFIPAVRADKTVAAWMLQPISLIMQ